MLKQDFTYENFDGVTETETLHFNLTKIELTENLHLEDEVRELDKMLTGPKRQLETGEIQRILDLVKELMRLSYGVRSEDGKRFIKSPQVWEEFTQTATYDAFLYSLFIQPEKAVEFIVGILPADLRQEAEKQIAAGVKAPEAPTETPTADIPMPSAKKPQDMSREELLAAYQAKSQG